MKTFPILLLAAGFLAPAFGGTVITANLPANTAIINISGTQDGIVNFNGDKSLWFNPIFTGGATQFLQYTFQPGTYTFHIVNPADAAQLFPALTLAQTNQIFTAWTFNTPCLTTYVAFDSAATNNSSLPQLFDGASGTNYGNSGIPLYGSYPAAYAAAYTNSSYDLIRTGPNGYDSLNFTNTYTFTNVETLIFAIPDYALGDNGGGVSILVSPVNPSIATTIDGVNRYAYAANFGWLDWRGDTNNGAVIGEYVCSGYIYSANFGWINLGSGAPTNGIYYQNVSSNDFGVNQDGSGNLRGYAYGANIGWINFENTGAPKVDLSSGNLSGYAWSANWGWISLSNGVAYVQTDTIQKGALDVNGLPIAWELENFGHTGVDPNADPDGDGINNLEEYLAGTDPNNGSDFLAMTFILHRVTDPPLTMLQWTAKPTRFYAVQQRSQLDAGSWSDLAVLPNAGASSALFGDPTNQDFYRVRAFRPLTP
jgi:hypothetical protein